MPWQDGHEPFGVADFPEPQGLNINMMPFIMGKKETLPEACQQYWPLIEQCNIGPKEIGKVGYLTVKESLVNAGESQRRAGVHIETPGRLVTPGTYKEQRYNWGCGIVRMDRSTWEGGIYMASNVPSSCKVWDLVVKDPAAAAGKNGDLEHLREVLGEGKLMEANKIYWLTDATPHESLPLEESCHRQFFRLVTSSLSVWYPEHSTKNDLVEIDTSITEIVEGSKFDN